MQAVALETSRPVARQSGTGSAAAPRAVDAAQHRPATQEAVRSAAVPHRGLRTVDPQYNRRVAAAQQALQFLVTARKQLRDIETALAQRSADAARAGTGARKDGEPLDERIRQFAELWSTRSRASGGLLGRQLELVRDGVPRLGFTVRGLDFATLRSGPQELLSLAVEARGRTEVSSVLVEPHLSDDELVKRFDRALAPVGVRATRGADGELRFEAAESAWPAIRDTLAIRGEGRRFPTGRFNRVPATPEPPAIRPQEWSVEDVTAREGTLRKVQQASEHLRRAHLAVTGLLAEESTRLAAAGQAASARADAQWCAQFVRIFEAAASQGDYRMLAAAAPAVTRLSRERVIAALKSL